MRVIAVILIVTVNLQCNRAEQKVPTMSDMDRIQGTWALLSGERHGEKFSDDVVKNVTLRFVGNVLTTQKSDDVTKANFILHSEMNPKGIDLDMNGSLGLGIYKLEADTLTILHGEIEQPRPANFESVESGELTLLVLKKEKQEQSSGGSRQ